ncbi:cell division topological specificity factor [Komagataeibacter europaeus]|uniref:Cell division topological specificity factor n=2 Tax=Komagataeibacter europaeus TaxID=33995 RepID=A0A0D6Q0J6_KOMEU|nr:cell division topological specificity factor MinE [Komagataeibacter europaeus]ARW17892.1 Cell division topological specificity factor [Komagataeibacter europaeus]KON64109.1 cell division topological specificity factor [Komagataeibacter europaeus]GAN96515.1 cell division topological specificity factor MinE [Komagataeibacter europaeus NBRC 3261]GBQ50552.1 cell division topological specificity factor MinE [Komagataeibacter europaeus LMG 18890]
MGLFDTLFGRGTKTSAPVARDRLQILLAHERTGDGNESDLLSKLQAEILEVIKRHIPVEQEKVQVKLDRGNSVSMLEIDIEVPQIRTPGRP